MGQRPLETDDEVITAGEALFMFRDLRQEVTVLAQLDHPFIVSLLGEPVCCCCLHVYTLLLFTPSRRVYPPDVHGH